MQYPNRTRGTVAFVIIAALVASTFLPRGPASAQGAVPQSAEESYKNSIEIARQGGAISYTVAFTRDVTSEAMGRSLLADAGLTAVAMEFANGEGSAEFMATTSQAEALERDPHIAGLVATPPIEPVGTWAAPGRQANPGWALDSLDGRNDDLYAYDFTGETVHAYVVDSRAQRHPEFKDQIGLGYDALSNTNDPYRCTEADSSHGTFVSLGLAGRASGTGRGVTLHNVAVAECVGILISNDAINDGLLWIEEHLELPAVINLSFRTVTAQDDDVLFTYEQTLLRLMERGAVVVAAGGNGGDDACLYAPARLPGVFAIGALDADLDYSPYSSSGPCVDAFAPGYGVPIAGTILSGTSFSSPYGAGLIAQVLEPQSRRDPAAAVAQVLMNARRDIGAFNTTLPGTPNARLQTNKAADRRAPLVDVRTRPTGNELTRAIVAIEPESYVGESFEVFLDGESRVRGVLERTTSEQTVIRLNGIPAGKHSLHVKVAGTKIYTTQFSGVAERESITVIPAVSCLGTDGRVDLNIVNTAATTKRFRIKFGALSPREYDVAPGDYWRMPFTGRPDGEHKIVISADGFDTWESVAYVRCDDPGRRVASPEEIQVVNACKAGNGYFLFQFLNESESTRSYVIEFGSAPKRSTSAAAGGQTTRAVSGRPDGVYPVRITSGSTVIANFNVIVDCDNKITSRDTVSAR